MDIDEILDRLRRGEVLMIDDQIRSYITLEDDDMPSRFVMRRCKVGRPGDTVDWRSAPATPYRSLAEALLSLEDYKWISK
jgi:hypothetical protein